MRTKLVFVAVWAAGIALACVAVGQEQGGDNTYLDDLLARYQAYLATSPVIDDTELISAVNSISEPYAVDLVGEESTYQLRWNPETFSVEVDRSGVVEELPAAIENGRLTFGSGASADDPSDGGWIGTFEGNVLYQVTIDGQVTVGAISAAGDAGGTVGIGMWIKKVCTCVGDLERCNGDDCDNGRPCGRYSRGKCTWLGEAAPAPPPATSCNCGSANATLSLATILGCGFMKCRFGSGRFRRRGTA